MTTRNANQRFIFLASFIIPLFIVSVTWYLNGFYPFGDQTVMAIDFGNQYIDLFAFMGETFRNGEWGNFVYSFNKSIGGSTVGLWAYYLLSPFNLLYVLFPKDRVVDAAHLGIFLRYGCMSLSMAYYLYKRQYRGYHRWLIPIFSSIYALSGFAVAYQMNPLFMDSLIMLPLILIGLEELLDDRYHPWKFIIFLSFAIFINFYQSFMISIFIVLYTIYYIVTHYWQGQNWRKRWLEIWRRGWPMALSAILAAGIVAFFIIPLFFNLLYSKGELSSGMNFEWQLQLNPLEILSKFMIGAFDNNSWSAGPNLPNVFVGSLPLIGAILFFFNPNISKEEKIASILMISVFVISISHRFTNQLWHMGQSPAGFFHRFSWLFSFFIILIAFRHFMHSKQYKMSEVFFVMSILLLVVSILITQSHTFQSPLQLQLSALCFGLMALILLIPKPSKWILVFGLVIIELGSNMFISQTTLNYPSLSSFQDAVSIMSDLGDKVRPSDDEFYRINPLFYRSKNDPFMQNYAGFTNFSSNLENNTRNLFYLLGSNGINAATTYNGSKVTDAIFSVKYHIEDIPASSEDGEVVYNFRDDFIRPGVKDSQLLVDETERFDIYQNPNWLPIAFGVNQSVVDLQLIKNRPLHNHNAIGQAMLGEDEVFFREITNLTIQLDNMKVVQDAQDKYIVQKEDAAQKGSLSLTFAPRNDNDVYVQLPESLRQRESNSVTLNDGRMPFLFNYNESQFVNIVSDEANKLQKLTISTESSSLIDLSELRFVELDESLVEEMVERRQDQTLDVEHWRSNYIVGNIDITDSEWVFTSVPYDRGWRVKIDNESVEPIEIWDGLLAFPITEGQHRIEMKYVPIGLIPGLFISIVTLIITISIFVYFRRYKY